MIRRVVVLLVLVGGALLLAPLRVPTEGVIAPRSLFLFGILLLVADTLGALAHDLSLPRLVGYVVAGAVLGPSISSVVPTTVLNDLGMMKNLALGLIGLLAGAELRLDDLRQRWRAVVAILTLQVVIVVVAIVPTLAALRPLLPFGEALVWSQFLLIALLFAVMLTANSPMVTLALLSEGHAKGPLAKTTLGVVLVADVVVIFLFTIALSLASSAMGEGGTDPWAVFQGLSHEVGASLLAGSVIGAILTLYVRYVKRELVVFAVVVVFASAAAAEALHFELLLSLLVAGFLFENVAPVRAEPMLKALEYASIPVFVVFFALTGAELRLASFLELWPVVLVVALVRVGALYGANRWGAGLGGAEPVVRRYGWLGLVPQAGVALGLAAVVANEFPGLGTEVQALTVGIITLNTSLGPILFRRALGWAGEVAEEGG